MFFNQYAWELCRIVWDAFLPIFILFQTETQPSSEASRSGNVYQALQAYHKMGVVFDNQGMYEEARWGGTADAYGPGVTVAKKRHLDQLEVIKLGFAGFSW